MLKFTQEGNNYWYCYGYYCDGGYELYVIQKVAGLYYTIIHGKYTSVTSPSFEHAVSIAKSYWLDENFHRNLA